MSYSTKYGRKPFERASKSSHRHIINDPEVRKTLAMLNFPLKLADLSVKGKTIAFTPDKNSSILNIIAVDSGYTEIEVRPGFPSSLITFFQFGVLPLPLSEIKKLNNIIHISPEDMAKLNNIDRLKLVLPTKGVRKEGMSSLQETIRVSIHDFFSKETLGFDNSLLDTLKWFVFRQYKGNARTFEERRWKLSSNPLLNIDSENDNSVLLYEDQLHSDGTFTCSSTGKKLYLIDIFRFHEIINEETGATGIYSYLAGVIEHIIAIHMIRQILLSRPKALTENLFIMDRPTGFFGQTARLHVLMIELINWLFDHHQIYWAGIEKSGAFVDHAMEIQNLMPSGSILILDDQYIYRYISLGEEQPNRAYADTSYYGHKIIFKTPRGSMHVISIPVRSLKKSPKTEDLPNLQKILTHIEQLHCDKYDSAIIPIALVNNLVSLSDQPSKQILKSFAKLSIL